VVALLDLDRHLARVGATWTLWLAPSLKIER
jgi:hypothetical protein